ncbi:MAG TPA: murein biosynthesis integral membrane protein MurJ [Candidatus Dormibacteraeota bacterium]|nr:murein biosynthesis integral membrane protein MurJ [Candidatus Dormibacteraeota bacterium]
MTDVDAAPFEDLDGIGGLPERTTARSLARAGITVASVYLVARLLGYVRVVVIGTAFGAGDELDAFFAAFRIPDLIFQLVAAGAIASALVPMVAGLLAKGETARAWRVVSTLANLMLVGLLAFAIVGFIAAPALVAVIAPGFAGAKLERTIELTRLMLLSPMFLALGAVATAALNGGQRFGASAIAPVIYNLAIIGSVVLLAPTMGVTGVALGVVAGSLGHLLVQVPPLARLGYRYVPRIDLDDAQARMALALMGPRVIGLGVTQITFVVMTAIASGLGAGAVSAYSIAFSLLQIPLGVIGTPLGIVTFPSMARELALGRTSHYLEILSRSLRILAFVMLPLTALGMVLRVHVVELLLGYGKFDQAAVQLTADTLLLFLIGLTAHSAIAVLAPAFYARRNTRTPTIAAILAVVINCALAVTLVGPLGLPAIGLAIAVAAWSEAIALVFWLRRSEPAFDIAGVASVLARCLVAAAVAAAVAFVVLQATAGPSPLGNPPLGGHPGQPKVEVLIQAIVATAAGGAAYVAVAALLRVRELNTLVAIVVDLVRRRGRA